MGSEPGAAKAVGRGGDPVAMLRQRLRNRRVGAAAQRAPTISAAELAVQLGGCLIEEGLIVVEQRLPFRIGHGEARIDDDTINAALEYFGCARGPTVFMDTETTGLAGGTGTLVFLLGLGRVAADTLQINQYFLSAVGGESTLLAHAQNFLDGAQTLVTYNGKGFDHPLLKTRYHLARIADPFAALHHLDLLYTTRRAYAKRWPDCRLKTAEVRMLGFRRAGDIPGSEIPSIWFDWMRRGSTALLPRVLQHNRWDIVSLAELLPMLHRCYLDPVNSGANIIATMKHCPAQPSGRQRGYDYLLNNRAHLDDEALMELARLARQQRNWALATGIWDDLMTKGNPEAIERLAKYYEHVARDYDRALQLCRLLIRRDGSQHRHGHRETRLLARILREGRGSEQAHDKMDQ